MGILRRSIAKVCSLWARKQYEEDLAREIASHLTLMADDFERHGMSPEEAQRAARRAYGRVEQSKQAHRDERTLLWAEQLIQDLRYCLRSLSRSPGFTITAVLTLALGIGAATAMFVLMYGVFFRPLPYPDEARLFCPVGIDAHGKQDDSAPYDAVERWRNVSAGSAEIALTETPQAVLDTPSGPQLINDVQSTTNLMAVLNVQPILGRGFAAEEAEAGRSHVALLSYTIWHDEFLADPHILGREVYIDGERFSVVGVMPQGFMFPLYKERAQVWTPLENGRLLEPPGPNNPYYKFSPILRVRAGIDPLSVQTALSGVQAQVAKAAAPGLDIATHVHLASLRDTVVGEARPALKTLLIAVALVWLIACSNVAGLLLARISTRRSEIAIRGALGAGSARIARQFLVESLLLSLVGAAVGVSLAVLMLRGAGHLIDRSLPLHVSFALNGPLSLTLLAFSVLTALAFGVVPAVLATRFQFAEGLRIQSQTTGTGRPHVRLRNLLLVCEVATSLTLLTAAGLMLRTLQSLEHAPLGFRTDHILVSDITLPGTLYKSRDVSTAAWQPLLERVQSLPGVRAAALSTVMPITHSTEWRTLIYKTRWTKENVAAEVRAASPNLMQVLGVRILKGRFLTEQDVQGSLPVAVVNQTFVNQFLGGNDPIGKQIKFGRIPATATIVGVLEDVRQDAVSVPSKPEFYISMAQLRPGDALYLPLTGHSMQLAVRTQTSPDAMAQSLSQAIHNENPQLIIGHMRTMDESVEDSIGTQRLIGGLVLGFAGLALLVTVVGLYGLLTYTVIQRTREVGIRMALGADRGQVISMILRQSLILMVAGITIGIGGSLWANQLLKSFLYGVSNRDPWVVVAGSVILLASGTMAAFVPARRAASVDPMQALRNDN